MTRCGQWRHDKRRKFEPGPAATPAVAIEGYSCSAGNIVWADTMATVVEAGSKPTPQAEIDTAGGQAWGERVLQARSGS